MVRELATSMPDDFAGFNRSEANTFRPSTLRPIIMDSWRRSREYGVYREECVSSVVLTAGELELLLRKNSELIDAAMPFIHNLYRLVASSGFVVILVDREGYILEVVGAVDRLGIAENIHYVKGMKWTEELVGTTAIGLALRERQPIQVAGDEHYCCSFRNWACSAAPIVDENNDLLGVLSVTGLKKYVHCHTLGMAVSAATAMTNILRERKIQKKLEQSAQIHSTIVHSISDGLLMLDKNGIVTFINPTGARILGVKRDEATGRHISSIVDFKPVVLQVLERGQGYADREFFIETRKGVVHFIKTAIPIRDKDGNLDGVIDIFREIKKVRQLVNRMVGSSAKFSFDDILGSSAAVKEVVRMGKIAANSFANLLIQGESGTGKEMIAQAVHNASARAEGPFIAINCGAIPRDLVESELFGYEEGAFTGARHNGRPGKFELAHGGTIFLDEIGETPVDIQVKLLRVLQDKRILRVGGQRYIDVDVRVIAATNLDLHKEVKEGNFRSDLYYRLNVLQLIVPPLREREGDIVQLAEFFFRKMCDQFHVPYKRVAREVWSALEKYSWPGNVRELENCIERAVSVSEGDEILPTHLAHSVWNSEDEPGSASSSLKAMEKTTIMNAIRKTKGNISRASKLLGIGRNTLYDKMREYAIRPSRA